MPMSDSAKQHAARLAADMVCSGMVIGLGSGSTATIMIERLGQRVATEGLDFAGVPTSLASAKLAASFGINLVDLDSVDQLDLNIDGADEVDPQYRMIKGRGGALLREKIVATAARRRVFIVSEDKHVARLGERFPVPVEVSPFGIGHAVSALRRLGSTPVIRPAENGSGCYITDGGNQIVDCRFANGIVDPADLDIRLRQIPGVFETGLFLGLCTALIVGHPDRADLIEVGTVRSSG
jgi:ribose 5-phosphate isomerase A